MEIYISDIDNEKLGNLLWMQRLECGYTLDDTSETAGIHPDRLLSIESGLTEISLREIRSLCKVIDLDPVEVIRPLVTDSNNKDRSE